MSERHEEYLRRNIMHAKSVGARAGLSVAQARLSAMKRPPKWMVKAVEEALKRIEPLPHELAQWRNAAPDAPSTEDRG